jgi:Type VI secretion system VasI, EvfG, VC_A0118
MGTFRSPIASALFLMTTVFVSAEPRLNQAEARRCSAIADDEKRLRCFDDLFSNKPSEPNAIGSAGPKSSWSIIEGTSPTDSSPQFSAGMVAGDAALILRCREQKTEAAFSTRDTYLGDESVTVRFRIDLQEPTKEMWRSSMNGRAAFAPHPLDFIRALPDSGRIFIRALTADGNNKDANFQLAGVSEIREKIARACNWPSVSDEPTTGTIKPSQSR